MTTPALLTAAELRPRLDRREISAREVLDGYRLRIEALDGKLNAFVRLNPGAEAEADEADRRLARGESGPLLGIPVALKDNLNTAGLETTCASRILRGFVPRADATAVERLRAAGAPILGKTNMDEFAMGSSTENSCFGPTRNPWDLERVPGGSSGGSAAAVAATMAPLALGSDTGGSVRQPAAYCGVIGMKPTYGRVSRFGLIAFGSSLDQIGPLGRSVADVAALQQAISGHDPRDSTSASRPVGDYAGACGRGVAGSRIGLPVEFFDAGLDPEIDSRVRQAARALEQAGATIEEISLPHTRFAIPAYYLIATAEASSNLARFDAVRYGRRVDPGGGLRGMYRASRGAGFGTEVKRRIMLGTYALSAGYYDAFYGKASRVRTLLARDLNERFESGIDLLLAPTTPSAAFLLGEKVEDPLQMYLNDVYTATANLSGLPAISMPLGSSAAGLPIGGQLIGPPFGEEAILGAAAVLEQSFPATIPPWVAESLGPSPQPESA